MNISFDLAAVILDIILLLTYGYIIKYPFKVYRAYISLVLMSLFTVTIDIVSTVTIEYPFLLPMWVNYFINIAFYIAQAYTLVLLYYYILATTGINSRSILSMLTLYVPFAADVAIICLSPFTHTVFYFDENGDYMHGEYNYLTFIIAGFYVVISTIVIISKIRKMKTKKAINILGFILVIISCVIIQYIFPNQLLISFSASVCMLILIFSVESPSTFLDKTNSVTTDNFMSIMHQSYLNEIRFSVILINIRNIRALFSGTSQEKTDEFLKTVTDFMYSVGKETVVCRHGVGSFLLKIDKCTNADDIANLIKQRFAKPWNSPELGEITLSAAIGYIACPKDAKNCNEFIEILDILSKNVHLSHVTSVSELGDTKRQREVLQAIKDAMANKMFDVYYQPIYSAHKKRITSAEALIRLKDERLGFISPEEFIPIAEKEGYILQIGNYVFEEVCRFISEYDLKNLGIDYIEVNLSVVQCMQYKIAEQYKQIMAKYKVNPELINLEITETAAIISYDSIKKNINTLCDSGMLLSLDDYGTGYSNMSYLYTMPFNYIKVDKCILWSVDENEKALTVLKNTFLMAKKLNLKIIMEGVETKEQAQLCTSLGVDYMQGYLYSKAVSGEDFVKFIMNFNGVWECD